MRSLFLHQPRLILFGMLTAFFSGPGQTFLVSVFTPHLTQAFELSSVQFGMLYSAATLIGALALPTLGRLLDRLDLLKFTGMMGVFLCAGCLTLATATGVAAMIIGFALIRSFGQGAMSLISSTTTARFFLKNRGRALSLSGLGHPLASAVYPVAVSFWVAEYGWRNGWLFLAGLICLVFFPAIFWLLNKRPLNTASAASAEGSSASSGKSTGQSPFDTRVWRHPVFIPAVLVGMITPFTLTALFLYQFVLGEWKGWDPKVMAAAFICFSLARALSAFTVGPLVDRFTARRLFAVMLLPLSLGVLTLLLGQSASWAFVYLTLLGMTVGMGMTIKPALWAELFGPAQLGRIKGLTGFFAVFSTAISPPLMGWLMDQAIPFTQILWGTFALSVIALAGANLVSWRALRTMKPAQY